ncbi:SMP-30/gluconolactonase/LRE family protein [Sulfitobacter sp. HGT1]|uniref:SMP-30/gluconolactonase/LRE family protein n=1 Tax=Sulfitobacter sp. HGT1 TaxID=2735435 RepID=UPI001592D039|nr:SMP-30/gluconolactonase/LRE family protein [Sulfitobacter sp. HGT1]
MSTVFDARICELGEGPFWHPGRCQLFWFDILGKRMLSRRDGADLEWKFNEYVSAAGWIDNDTLLIASQSGLYQFEIASGLRVLLHSFNAEKCATRTNDGRADPQGGFWISTMGTSAQEGVGAIYRFHRGKLTKLYSGLTIPNSICFSPDGHTAYYTDSPTGVIMRQTLDAEGWPVGAASVFVDISGEGMLPDGSVVDANGGLWNARWGAGLVARYFPNGDFDRTVKVPGLLSSCPAFGGKDFSSMFVTTAREGLDTPSPNDGKVYELILDVCGIPEHRIQVGA